MIKITDFGASTDFDNNAQYIQRAIDSLENGGCVCVPSGVFLTGYINLKSNITLYLESGAVLKAIEDASIYPKTGLYGDLKIDCNTFIYAKDCENIKLCGEGTIDISSDAFLDYSVSEAELMEFGEVAKRLPAKPLERISRPILFNNCKHIDINGIKVINSPAWTLTFHASDDVKVTNVTIDNNLRTPHSDGVHLSGCNGAIVSGCNFKCGDDCVAITSLHDNSYVCKNIIVSDCVFSSSSSAIRIGHKGSRVTNVLISNIIIDNTNRGFAIFAGDNGFVRNVKISHVLLETKIVSPYWWGRGEPFVICCSNSTGKISNITLTDIQCVSENKAVIDGNISKLKISDCSIVVNETELRKYAITYDIAPNGYLEEENDFKGVCYIGKGVNGEINI